VVDVVVVDARVVVVVAGATVVVVVVVEAAVVDDVLVVVAGTVVDDDVEVVDRGGATVVLVVSVDTVSALAERVVVPMPADINKMTQTAAIAIKPTDVTIVMRLRRRDRSPRSIPTHRRDRVRVDQARTKWESVASHLPFFMTVVVTSTL
jgi:hypothetical protein